MSLYSEQIYLPCIFQSLILIGDIFAELVELWGGPGAPVYECCHEDQEPHNDTQVPESQEEVE